ncbi:MAG: 2-hydroxychromene-2-carboxylate isomerase [Hyphomicrobiales bacterium]
MSAGKTIDFWFEFASTYSYLTAMRIEEKAAEASVKVRWKVFNLGPIFGAQGWTSSPFNLYPAKGAYMWRDMERMCSARDLELVKPDPFPQNSLNAARLALAAEDEPWLIDFCKGVYLAEFTQGKQINEPETLGAILQGLGVEPEPWLELITQDHIKQALKTRVAEAVEHGIFGAPSFISGDELFWGDDRLEQALEFAK